MKYNMDIKRIKKLAGLNESIQKINESIFDERSSVDEYSIRIRDFDIKINSEIENRSRHMYVYNNIANVIQDEQQRKQAYKKYAHEDDIQLEREKLQIETLANAFYTLMQAKAVIFAEERKNIAEKHINMLSK